MQATQVGGQAPQPRHPAIDVLGLAARMLGTGLAIGLALAAMVLLLASGAAHAAEMQAVPLQPSEAGQGTLLFRSDDGSFPAPLLDTDVTIRVSGPLARAHVVQTFRNPGEDWLEGIYVFPLPENAAVDRLRMRIGERIVEGVIRERGEAKARYEEAARTGRRAALVEQERPNLFTTSVANIGPGQEITVEIEYQQTLAYEMEGEAGRYSLRFPMVAGPRYIPGAPAGRQGTGWSPDTDQVVDASRITPPVRRPDEAVFNPVRMRVELDAGVPLAGVDSPYHEVSVDAPDPARRVVELARGATRANRDFELTWTLAPGRAPRVALFTEPGESLDYALLMVVPPAFPVSDRPLPREVVFVIDTSGSMEGTSIIQAREALALALERLAPEDRFNVIEFNSHASALFEGARPAGRENVEAAVAWVRHLRAQGGTEMAQALDLALDGREDPARVRQVIFLTDGAVGNEESLFRLIERRLGDSRLFTVGIGSAPNSHFMTKAARAGRGTFTYIGKVDEVKDKMSALFAKLESPVLKGVEVEWPEGSEADAWPQRIPDLYQGEPILVSAAFQAAPGALRITGWDGDARWSAEVPLEEARTGTGLGVVWARQKIDSLLDELRDGADEAQVKAAVMDLALEHHLVTRYTSLVAVDRTPVRPKGNPLTTAPVPADLPEGWNFEAVFGELPQGATDARWSLLTGLVALLLAALLWRMSAARFGRSPRAWTAPYLLMAGWRSPR